MSLLVSLLWHDHHLTSLSVVLVLLQAQDDSLDT